MRKYGCAAEIAAAPDGTTEVLARPGWLLGGKISRLVDRGYQKFLKTPQMEVPATAEHLHAIHEFSEEMKEAAGRPVCITNRWGRPATGICMTG